MQWSQKHCPVCYTAANNAPLQSLDTHSWRCHAIHRHRYPGFTMPPRRTPPATATKPEARTRKELIDPALVKAGWDVTNPAQVGLEIPVDGADPAAVQAVLARLRSVRDAAALYNTRLSPGISDYALYRPNGEIIAVVEAKKTSIDPRLAQAQAEFYVGEIAKRQSFRPFAFMTNGEEIYFLDAGAANKRLVAGFFSPADLENLLYLRLNGQPLAQAPIDEAIVNRPYQHEAVRRVAAAFDSGKRKALLVMATGTGKTRTAMALIDVFLRTNGARRVLFVADRDELVRQALDDGFKVHLPNEPCTRIFSDKIDTSSRLYAVTLQTLNMCYGSFTPGFFDLIVFDEVHRSIFNKWNEVVQYFDARMVGLTATPAGFIDRNTFLTFECDDNLPTFLYSYKQAVAEGFLVDYSLYRAKTKFQRKGIKGVDLSEEERNQLIERGIDPDEISFEGSELERAVSNRDTLRQQWHEIMEQCLRDESGQLPSKTIVFAITQEHALRLESVFEELYPQFPGLARVITYKSNYKGALLDQFKKQERPRIAITVDLLETGVDVPEVVNLVVMKPVQSRIKLEQMIGRGTRSDAACKHREWLPDGRKSEFVVLDFWENDFDKSPTEELSQSLPVSVTLFNTRLRLLELDLADQGGLEARRTVADLRGQVVQLPADSFLIKKQQGEIAPAFDDGFWRYLTPDAVEFLRRKVGPLLRYAPAEDVAALTFTSKVERLKLQLRTKRDAAATIESIRDDVVRLPTGAHDPAPYRAAIDFCLGTALASATPAELDQVIDTLASEMRRKREKENLFLALDLPDQVELRGFVLLKGGSEPVYISAYRQRVEQRVLDLIDRHPTIEALARGDDLSDAQLIALERTLREELGAGALELSEENVRKAWGFKVGSLLEFLRRLLDLSGVPDYAEIVNRRFAHFIAAQPFSADQIAFLRVLQSLVARKRRLEAADLYEPPLTRFGSDAADRWFSDAQRAAILELAASLSVEG